MTLSWLLMEVTTRIEEGALAIYLLFLIKMKEKKKEERPRLRKRNLIIRVTCREEDNIKIKTDL